MSDIQPVYLILTTFRRTSIALRTIAGIKDNLRYQNLGWILADDGSSDEEINQLVSSIGSTNHLWIYRSPHKGTGHNMNIALQHVWDIGGSLTLMMEDDWLLEKPMDLTPYVDVLTKHLEHGMIRFGYIAAGIAGELINEEGRFYWKLTNNGTTYRYTGHPALRNKAFYDAYGKYTEGLAPGATELAMCGAVNSRPGPNILLPADSGWYGFFAHIGAESLADIQPE